MPLCRPEATLGGKTFWTLIKEDSNFVIQHHKLGRPFWFSAPYRILLKCNNYVIAESEKLEEIEEDWTLVRSYFDKSNIESSLPKANLSILLSALFQQHWESNKSKNNSSTNNLNNNSENNNDHKVDSNSGAEVTMGNLQDKEKSQKIKRKRKKIIKIKRKINPQIIVNLQIPTKLKNQKKNTLQNRNQQKLIKITKLIQLQPQTNTLQNRLHLNYKLNQLLPNLKLNLFQKRLQNFHLI